MGDNDRPQDVGRSHHRRTSSSASLEILERYRQAMRDELGRLLDELAPAVAVQTSLDGTTDRVVGMSLSARRERWDLAIKLGKELGGAPETPLEDMPASSPTAPRARKAPRLTARDRSALA